MNYSYKLGGILCLGVALFATLSSVEQNSTETSQIQYIQNPPIAKNYWVQKIRTPDGVQGGEYSVVLKAEFEHDMPLPDALIIYKNGEVAQVLHDDGNYPDERASDGIYATIVNQDPTEFANQVQERLSNIQTRGYAMDFTGHSGEIMKFSDVKRFDNLGFQNFETQEFDEILIEEGSSCSMDENEIKKTQSLFITDLRVVENQGRTYNVVTSQGTAQGAWTFGELMKNMAGGFADEADPDNVTEVPKVRDFLKKWVIELYTEYSFNGKTSPQIEKKQVLQHVVKPWIVRARMDLGDPIPAVPLTNTEDWKLEWDAFTTDEEIYALLANAPFKLSAIVNRIDLRGNSGYASNNVLSDDLVNGGETRFIFSLVQTIEDQGSSDNDIDNLGQPPWHHDTGYGPDAGKKIDWRGMNVILEYANITSTPCDIKSLGQQWKDLSNYDINNSDPAVALSELTNYLNALENITNLVTARNANPNGTNGSAISQVRTNSKLFAIGNVVQIDRWTDINWELREFGLNQDGDLVSQPTANMPFASNNIRRNSLEGGTEDSHLESSQDIVDWIYGVNGPSKAISVRHGNHNIPQHLLEPVSELKDELQSHYSLGYWHSSFPNNIYDDDNYNSQASAKDKDIRHQLSLNTCMGCHGGETKTMFTMVQPLGYGQEADYWSSIPATTTGDLDNGNQISNAGYTLDPNHPDAVNGFIPNHKQEYYTGASVHESRTIALVSPFLTGRNYREGIGVTGNARWNDDLEDPNNPDELLNHSLNDNKITGLFYVNDPTNEADVNHNDYIPPSYNNVDDTPFPQVHTKKHGFNELENRQLDLCLLTSTSCSNSDGGVLDVMAHLDFIPLPLHGH